MNPALMNYLQQQQMNQSQQGTQGGGQQAPAPYNPFDAGLRRGVESARESLGMSQGQQDRAMRGAISSFGQNIGNQPKVAGFWNNLGQIGRAALPAIDNYDQQEQASLAENNAIANQILNRQAQEQARVAQDEERTWQHEFAERKFAESQRQHNLMYNFAKAKSAEQEGIIELGGVSFRKLDKVEQRHANNLKSSASNNALAVREIEDSYEKLKELTENNRFASIGGFSNLTNKAKDIYGRFAANKNLREETAARKDFEAQLGKLNTALEAVKSGGGKLGQGMYDRLKPFFPDPEKDDLPTLEKKMAQIKKEANMYNDAAQLASKYGISIDPADVESLFGEPKQPSPKTPSTGGNTLHMVSPKGVPFNVPEASKAIFEENGYKVVE